LKSFAGGAQQKRPGSLVLPSLEVAGVGLLSAAARKNYTASASREKTCGRETAATAIVL
jgi:hypothetical protein